MRILQPLTIVAVLACGFVLEQVSSKAQVQDAKPEIKPVTLNLELLASRPLLRVGVNGKGPFGFLLSPEADETVIDHALAAELKLKTQTGAGLAAHVTLVLELGSASTEMRALLTDTSRFVPELAARARPRGVISLSTLKNQLVTIDYAQWRVIIEHDALPDAHGTDVFNLNPGREFTVPLTAGERGVPCRIDPLFAGGILLPASFAKDLPIIGRPLQSSVNTPRGTLSAQEARLAMTLRLASFDLPNAIVHLVDNLPSAVVGGSALTGFSITYDLTNRRARLQRPTRPSVQGSPFGSAKAGPHLALSTQHLALSTQHSRLTQSPVGSPSHAVRMTPLCSPVDRKYRASCSA